MKRGPNVNARGEMRAWLENAVRTAVVTECQLWPFTTNGTGYGSLGFNGRKFMAHQAALLLAGRDIPAAPLECRHTCGQPLCVNFLHIIPGTHAQNIEDKKAHGTYQTGEQMPWAQLTEADVRVIKASTKRTKDLAQEFGVTHAAISMIRSGKKWAHVDVPVARPPRRSPRRVLVTNATKG